jgi:peroxiredoxin
VVGSFTIRKELQGRCLIVFLPGSHTPTCSNHLPLLVATADKLNKLGINIIVVCVNKTDDLDAWAEKHDPTHKLTFIPDMNGELTLAAGVGAWSERLGLIANRVAIVKDDKDAILAVIPELNADKQQSNGQCVVTGKDIGERVLAIFGEKQA